jgi:mannose-1-phosphate guanylyltransferase
MNPSPTPSTHRHAVVIAGGSGTRLWPMSRSSLPKQLIPFIGGRSLLQIAIDRLETVVADGQRHICAGEGHRQAVLAGLPAFPAGCYLGEPMGRDTLAAIGLSAAVLARRDPQAVLGVFTADHVIEPVDAFRTIVGRGFALAEELPNALVTFGIAPTHAATAYGYLELGGPAGSGGAGARTVTRFKEKPDAASAAQYLAAGPEHYLWNSGMFVWRVATLLDCIRRYQPQVHDGLVRIAEAWDTPRGAQTAAEVYPTLKKISVDYAVMEPASRDPAVQVLAAPMHLNWLDVGSWPSFAQTCPKDAQGNALAASRHLLLDTHNSLIASNDPAHLIAAIGCRDLIVIHTPQATLICRADRAEEIKALHAQVAERFGPELL